MKAWRPLRMCEFPPPGRTRLAAPDCVCGDGKSAHGNPSHACDAGRYTPVTSRRILVFAEPFGTGAKTLGAAS